jgi:hypothetical protein
MRHLRQTVAVMGAALGIVGAALTAAPAAADSELAPVRAATAHYHRIEVALADGYQLGYQGVVTGCIAHPTDGAMGYHYFRPDLMADPAEDPLQPEGLVYAPGPNGQLRLVAVEWVVPGDVWAATGEPGAPSVLGQDLHVLNPALGWWIHHAWVWKHNPSGVYADWNPLVGCP